jgi:hypothetical protein
MDGSLGHRAAAHIGRRAGSIPGRAADRSRTGYRPSGRCAVPAWLRLPDRVQAVIVAYETGLVRPGAA